MTMTFAFILCEINRSKVLPVCRINKNGLYVIQSMPYNILFNSNYTQYFVWWSLHTIFYLMVITHNILFDGQYTQYLFGSHYRQYWSERSVCAAWSALQTGCMANGVATEFIVFFSLFPLSLSLRLITFLTEGVVLGL